MMRHSEVREKFICLLEQLPDIVDECEKYSKIYEGRNALLCRIHDIYVNVLLALEDMIHWYEQPKRSKSTANPMLSCVTITNSNSSERIVDSVLKNESYGQSIDVSLRKISESKQQFLDETRVYAARDTRELLTATRDIQSNVYSFKSDFDKVTPTIQAMNSNLEILVDMTRNAECMYHMDKT
jgi:hypothetical protein